VGITETGNDRSYLPVVFLANVSVRLKGAALVMTAEGIMDNMISIIAVATAVILFKDSLII
jgi:hypothetical protein